MSWQPYIDDQLLAKGFMHAAIVSHGGSLWAASEDFYVHPSEVALLVAALLPPSDPAALEHLATRGFTLNEGGRYALTRADVGDEEVVPLLIGRCKTVGAPSTGVVVCATHSALVVGVYDGAYSEGASFGGVRRRARGGSQCSCGSRGCSAEWWGPGGESAGECSGNPPPLPWGLPLSTQCSSSPLECVGDGLKGGTRGARVGRERGSAVRGSCPPRDPPPMPVRRACESLTGVADPASPLVHPPPPPPPFPLPLSSPPRPLPSPALPGV